MLCAMLRHVIRAIGFCLCLASCGPATQVKCGKTLCPVGQVCCNESCGICAPPEGACIQLACVP